MESGMYIKGIRGLPSMSHGEYVFQTGGTTINKILFTLLAPGKQLCFICFMSCNAAAYTTE